MIKAVIFDLDDTLIPEIEYVKSGFRAIADYYNDKSLYNKLYDLFETDRQNVYQRAGFSEEKCKKCIEIYRSHMPDISLDDETYALLSELKNKGFLMGIITDGRPEGQWNKIKALGLDKIMDYIIVTDEVLGIDFRKPSVKAFELMREKLSIGFDEMMYVGDNPAKDFYVGSIYPITTIQIVNDNLYKDNEFYKNVFPVHKIKSLKELNNYL